MSGEIQTAYVRRLFLLFACRAASEETEPIIEAAVREVYAELKPDADAGDPRLCYYAAALAGLHYRRIMAAHAAVSPTYAGAVPANRDDRGPCYTAERIAERCRNDCADLLRDEELMLLPV